MRSNTLGVAAALCVAGLMCSGAWWGENADQKRIAALEAKLKEAKGVTSLMDTSLTQLKMKLWIVEQDVDKLSDRGQDWRLNAKNLERDFRDARIALVGSQGVQADYARLCTTVGFPTPAYMRTDDLTPIAPASSGP